MLLSFRNVIDEIDLVAETAELYKLYISAGESK